MPRTRGTRHGNGGAGPGWGGPARGNAGDRPPKPFTRDDPNRRTIPGGKGDEVKMRNRAERRALREQRVDELEDTLYELATGDDQPGNVRVTAAARLHAIYEGQPVARVITKNADDVGQLSDEDLRDELARLGREEAAPAEGDQAPGVSRKPRGILH